MWRDTVGPSYKENERIISGKRESEEEKIRRKAAMESMETASWPLRDSGLNSRCRPASHEGMTTMIKNDNKNKPEIPNLLCIRGTTGNGYVLSPTQSWSRGQLGFESGLAAGCDEEKTASWSLDAETKGQTKIASPIFGWTPKRDITPDANL